MVAYNPSKKFVAKAPSYAPREIAAIKAADRIVCRVRIAGEWKEMTFYPMAGQSVRSKLIEMQAEMALDPSCAKICLYVGGIVNGEYMIANVPHSFVPEDLV